MQYKENLQKASELTRMVIHTLSKYKIPVNPISFALWYEYFLGRNQLLILEIDNIQNESQQYSWELGYELFLKFIVTSEVGQLEKVENGVYDLLQDIFKIVTALGSDVHQYNDKVKGSVDSISQENDIPKLQQMVKSLLSETQNMVNINKVYENKLEATSEEIENLRNQLSKVREEASQDALTGLANRKAFDEKLESCLQEIKQTGNPLCLIMLDIDHFKKINDSYGHIVGDQVLKYIANTLKETVKGRDLVARYGGEEFGIILEKTPLSGALGLAEDIRSAIETSKLKQRISGKIIGDFTVSIGVEIARDNDSVEVLVNKADKSLYHSKNAGRNKVTCLSES